MLCVVSAWREGKTGMTLRNGKYKDRLLEKQLERHLRAFGTVEIVGSIP